MTRSLILISLLAAGLVSQGAARARSRLCINTTTPPTTISGVGVSMSGPPPKPSTPAGCARRWDEARNTSGRAAAKQRAPKADKALIQSAGRTGYFREDSGRCLIYLITPPKSAVVFVETALGRFTFTADATGRFSANAHFRQDTRLRLR